MKPHEIQEKLGLTRIRDRNWYVQPACATTGDGLYEGLTWLTSNHKSWVLTTTITRKTLFSQKRHITKKDNVEERDAKVRSILIVGSFCYLLHIKAIQPCKKEHNAALYEPYFFKKSSIAMTTHIREDRNSPVGVRRKLEPTKKIYY